VIVANALQARQFSQLQHYPLGYNSGQVSWLKQTPASQQIKTIICTNGYLIPAHQEQLSLGGSFVSRSMETSVSESAHQRNMGFLPDLAPTVFDPREMNQIIGGRAAVRCAVPDHLPLVGPVEDRQAFIEDYGVLARNARQTVAALPRYVEGLFVNIAHGSHGLTTAPLAAEYLAAILEGEVLPLQNPLVEALHPARFLLRDLRRQLDVGHDQ
jgi:tRNA 5-methylaminomethyl-2-thiouridine biosynthesis bifunctional protein